MPTLASTVPVSLLATLPPVVPDAAGGLLGGTAVDLPMLLCLPVLLVLSAFFSGSETALFGLSEAERMSFDERHPVAARAVDALLADRRMLLITILLGNMSVNVLYFVISSVLMMRSSAGPVGATLLAVGFLMLLVLVGEIAPKIFANTAGGRFAALIAPLLLSVHRLIGPIRIGLDAWVIAPLSRLTAPATRPPELHDEEFDAMLEISGRRGVIAEDEERMLRDVIGMRRLRVRDVMTPRIAMAAIPADATRADVVTMTRRHRLTRLPVYGHDLDHVVGMLRVGRYLLDPDVTSVTDPSVMTEARYVPDAARLDQLLDHLRGWQTKSAIVVDEYGGTEGIVAAEDVVEELVGDIVGADEELPGAPQLVGLGRWELRGDLDVEVFAEAFGLDLGDTTVATAGVLVAEQLGRAPRPGDRVAIGSVVVEVRATEGTRATLLVVTISDAEPPS